jgi:hypothetical protein
MDSPDTRIGLAFGSSRLPCQAAAQSTTPRTGRSSLIAAIQPQTPDPSTPELCWEDTPTASSTPATPEDDSDSDGGTPVPLSPSIAREHRAELRKIAPLGLPPSSKLRSRGTLKYNAPSIPFGTLIEKAIGIDSPKTISLSPVQNEHKLEDCHDRPSYNAQSSVPQMSETSSHRPTSTLDVHGDTIKLEGKDPVLPSELGGDSDEVPSHSGLCDPSITPVTPKASNNVKCESTSAAIGTAASPTSKIGLGTDGVLKALAVSGAADNILKLSVSWSPSPSLIRLLPNDVVERLRDSPRYCVATTLKGVRCKNKNAAKLTTEHVDKLLKDLSTLPSLLELSSIIRIVQDLASQATCLRCHQKPAKKEFLELSSCATFENSEEVSKATTNGSGAETTSEYNAFHLWAQSFLTAHVLIQPMVKSEVETSDEIPGVASTVKVDLVPSDDKSMTHVRAERAKDEPRRPGKDAKPGNTLASVTWASFQTRIGIRPHRKTVFSPRIFNPESRSCHLYHDFRPYFGSAKEKTKPASEMIRELLAKPLSLADSKAQGNIYMYWHPGNFGSVKIGKSVNTKKRLQDWQRQCKIEVEQVTSSSRNFEVHHPHRVERLIHAELKECRREEPDCPGCHRSHNEWFEVDGNLALRVVEKWSEHSLFEGKYLRESLTKADLEKLCEVTTKEAPKAKSRSKRPSTGRTRHLRKSSPVSGLMADPAVASPDDCKEVLKWRFSL